MAGVWAGDDIIVEHKDLKATAVALDSSGKFLVLAGRLGTSVIDINNPQKILRKCNRKSKWEVSVIAWNHHPEHRHLIAIGCNQKVDIVNFDYVSSELTDPVNSIKGHSRAVLDIDWNATEPTVLVTCSVDNYVYIWDLRDLRRPVSCLPSLCGAAQAKWSKLGRNLLATAHEAECKIWDFRKSSTPITYIAAHSGKINGLDWSNSNQIVTCSQDCNVKVWDIGSPKHAKYTISAQAPVWRARFVPFGDAIVTVGIPQLHRGDAHLALWSLNDTTVPTHLFSGHTEGVYDFFWRSPRRDDFQLVSWSKDQTLRLWKLDSTVQRQCGAEYNNYPIIHPDLGNIFVFGKENLTNATQTARNTSPPGSPHPPFDIELRRLDIPGVSVEDIDLKQGTCAVVVSVFPHVLKLLLSFPQGYPEANSPTFQIAPDSTLNPLAARQIVQALSDTLAKCLQNQALSVTAVVRTAQQFLNTLTSDLTPSPRLEGHPAFISPPARNPPSYKTSSRYVGPQRVESPLISAATAKLFGTHAPFSNDQPMPFFPRVVGGHFAGDKLVMWSDAWKLGFSSGSNKSMLDAGSTVYPSDLAAMQRQTRKALMKKGKAERPSIVVFNVQSLMPIHPFLAANYVSDCQNPSNSLLQNALLAESVDRRDLAHVWRLLQVAVQPVSARDSDVNDAPWALHPFGRRMIDKILDHFRDKFDSAFLANIGCILCEASCSQRLPHASSRGWKSTSFLSASSSTDAARHPFSTDEIFEGRSQGSLGLPKEKRSNSWVPPIMTNHKAISEELNNGLDKQILNPDRKRELDLFKREYCDLLYAFRLLNKRTEILKCLGEQPDPHRGIEFFNICHNCRCEVNGARCFSCKSIAVSCAICHAPVRGMSSFCQSCGHGGHVIHMEDWFSSEQFCPAGCGCICLEAVGSKV